MPQAPQETLDVRMRKNTERYKQLLDGTGPEPYNVPYRDMTSRDFSRLGKEGQGIVGIPLLMFLTNQLDQVDEIKPTAMTRAQYLNVLLREGRRLDILEAVMNNSGLLTSQEANTQVTVSRPIEALPGQARSATLSAGDVVFRDIAAQLLANPHTSQAITERDLSRQLGTIARIDTSSDIANLMLGYTAASNPAFLKNGKLPFGVNFPNGTSQNLVPAFCASISAIVEPGRPVGLNQNIATSTGVLLAREHASDNFRDTGEVIRFPGGTVCPRTPLKWNEATMADALTGWEVGRMKPDQRSLQARR